MQFEKKHVGLTGLLLLMIFHYGIAQQQAKPPLQENVPLSVKQAVDYALANQATVRTAKLDELIQLVAGAMLERDFYRLGF